MQVLSRAADFPALLRDCPLLIVQFGSASCAPCKAIESKLDVFVQTHPAAAALYVPIEAFPEVSAQNSVFTVPTILAFAEGREALRAGGYFGLEDFLRKVERLIGLMA